VIGFGVALFLYWALTTLSPRGAHARAR
jgi:hypothetical protein